MSVSQESLSFVGSKFKHTSTHTPPKSHLPMYCRCETFKRFLYFYSPIHVFSLCRQIDARNMPPPPRQPPSEIDVALFIKGIPEDQVGDGWRALWLVLV